MRVATRFGSGRRPAKSAAEVVVFPGGVEKLPEREHPARHVVPDHQNVAEVWQLGPELGQHGGVREASERVRDQHQRRLRVVQDVAHFSVAIHRPDRVGDGADLGRGTVRDEPLGPVRCLDGDDVAGCEAETQQATGHAAGQAVEVGKRQTNAAVDDGHLVAALARVPLQVVVERGVGPCPTLYGALDRLGVVVDVPNRHGMSLLCASSSLNTPVPARPARARRAPTTRCARGGCRRCGRSRRDPTRSSRRPPSASRTARCSSGRRPRRW